MRPSDLQLAICDSPATPSAHKTVDVMAADEVMIGLSGASPYVLCLQLTPTRCLGTLDDNLVIRHDVLADVEGFEYSPHSPLDRVQRIEIRRKVCRGIDTEDIVEVGPLPSVEGPSIPMSDIDDFRSSHEVCEQVVVPRGGRLPTEGHIGRPRVRKLHAAHERLAHHRIVDPTPVEAERNPTRQMDAGHRSLARIVRVEDDEIR